jgi:tRNA(fMet)-specific endonuclease VapC
MNLILDTNIILYICRNQRGLELLSYLNPKDSLIYVSFVSVAETQSIAFQNNWGFSKMQRLENFIENSRIIEVSDILIPSYIGIDAYSQRNHPDYKNYPFETPRNMGKNDLWIAATASILNLKLITTDQDFNHLDATFLSLQNVLQSEIKMFF